MSFLAEMTFPGAWVFALAKDVVCKSNEMRALKDLSVWNNIEGGTDDADVSYFNYHKQFLSAQIRLVDKQD